MSLISAIIKSYQTKTKCGTNGDYCFTNCILKRNITGFKKNDIVGAIMYLPSESTLIIYKEEQDRYYPQRHYYKYNLRISAIFSEEIYKELDLDLRRDSQGARSSVSDEENDMFMKCDKVINSTDEDDKWGNLLCNETLGKCCYCFGECNYLSQACGRCARDLTLHSVGVKPFPDYLPRDNILVQKQMFGL